MNLLALLQLATILSLCIADTDDSDHTTIEQRQQQQQQQRQAMSSMPAGLNISCAEEVYISSGVVNGSGVSCSLNTLRPYTEMFKQPLWTFSFDNTRATNTHTHETIDVAVYTSVCDDGLTTVTAQKDNNAWSHIKIDAPNSTDVLSTYFALIDPNTNKYYSYDETCIDNIIFGEGEVTPPEWWQRRTQEEEASTLKSNLRSNNRQRNIQSSCAKNRGGSSCSCMQAVDVGIVFDRDFCLDYGSKSAARSGIQMIINGASKPYEDDMCIQLKLVDAVGLGFDENCNLDGSGIDFASGFGRERPCDDGSGGLNFLDKFTELMTKNGQQQRNALGLSSAGIIHLFSGGSSASGAAGCAWIGTTCSALYGYGVDYIGKMRSSPESQAVIVAHEIGHNMGGTHVDQGLNGNFVMKPAVAPTHTDFSGETISRMLSKINSVTCDYQAGATKNSAPNPAPAPTGSNPNECSNMCNSAKDCGCAGFTCDYRFAGSGFAGRCSAGASKYAESRAKRRCRTRNGEMTGGSRCSP